MSSTAVRYKLNTRLVFAGHAVGKKDNVLRKFSKQNDAEPVEKRFQGKVIFPIETLVLILYHGPPVMEDGGPVGLPTLYYLHWDDDLGPVGLSTRKYQVIIYEANLFLFRESRWKPFVFRKESALTGSGRDCTHCWDLDKGPANKSGGAGHIYHFCYSGRFQPLFIMKHSSGKQKTLTPMISLLAS